MEREVYTNDPLNTVTTVNETVTTVIDQPKPIFIMSYEQ